MEAPLRLHDERLGAVVEALRAAGARVVADLGCGEAKLLYRLVRERRVERLYGLDPAARELEWASKHLADDPIREAADRTAHAALLAMTGCHPKAAWLQRGRSQT